GSRLLQREGFGMWLAGALVRTIADDDPLVGNDACADDRVRRGAAKAAARVLQCPPHPACVVYHFS
ncbi:MAG TPA: hypothetical protein VIK60_03795, partial [Vicinamibacterales bacterium]